MGGRALQRYRGNILQCMKKHERKPRMHQCRLLLLKKKDKLSQKKLFLDPTFCNSFFDEWTDLWSDEN